ncbi:hypothetical protein [Micromonospora sp. NPDC023956]|uniref:hypothetical protein n=1 Tax=Micromonospora sp. NPDC023956 TaxID=3155722 RepID=UPI0033C83199
MLGDRRAVTGQPVGCRFVVRVARRTVDGRTDRTVGRRRAIPAAGACCAVRAAGG